MEAMMKFFRLRFCLRTLLSLLTVIILCLGWPLATHRSRLQRENAAIAWVVESGGEVNYEYRPNQSLLDKATVAWYGKKKATRAYLHYQSVTDVSPLTALQDLQLIVLKSTPVADVTPLAKLKNLKTLDLENTKVSSEHVERLRKQLPNCRINYSPEPLTGWQKLVEDWRISLNRKQ